MGDHFTAACVIHALSAICLHVETIDPESSVNQPIISQGKMYLEYWDGERPS
jgi:hypothetical protein